MNLQIEDVSSRLKATMRSGYRDTGFEIREWETTPLFCLENFAWRNHLVDID